MDEDKQQTARKPVANATESVRDFIKRHRSPSTLFMVEKAGIVASLRNGRNIEQTAKEYSAKDRVCIELWLRNLDRRLTAIERDSFIRVVA